MWLWACCLWPLSMALGLLPITVACWCSHHFDNFHCFSVTVFRWWVFSIRCWRRPVAIAASFVINGSGALGAVALVVMAIVAVALGAVALGAVALVVVACGHCRCCWLLPLSTAGWWTLSGRCLRDCRPVAIRLCIDVVCGCFWRCCLRRRCSCC